jgi:hypothetical protein
MIMNLVRAEVIIVQIEHFNTHLITLRWLQFFYAAIHRPYLATDLNYEYNYILSMSVN